MARPAEPTRGPSTARSWLAPVSHGAAADQAIANPSCSLASSQARPARRPGHGSHDDEVDRAFTGHPLGAWLARYQVEGQPAHNDAKQHEQRRATPVAQGEAETAEHEAPVSEKGVAPRRSRVVSQPGR